jgi:hypothetical protein
MFDVTRLNIKFGSFKLRFIFKFVLTFVKMMEISEKKFFIQKETN